MKSKTNRIKLNNLNKKTKKNYKLFKIKKLIKNYFRKKYIR